MDPGPTGTYNQFVPQLMLGNSFANGTGPPEYYPAPSALNPLRSWYVQAQYFFKLRCQYEARGVFGEMVPVTPGDTVTTRFRLDGADPPGWRLTIEAAAPGCADASCARVSAVDVPHPFMNRSLSWADAPFSTTEPGACWEVYGMEKPTDYPPFMTYNITTTVDDADAAADDAKGGRGQGAKPPPFFGDKWVLTETPTCKQAPPTHTISATTSADGYSQEADLVIKQAAAAPM